MTGPEFENKWTIGNLITLAVMIVGGIFAFATLQRDGRAAQEHLNRLEVAVQSGDARIRALELGAGRTDEKLLNILTILSRIERQLDDRP